MALFDVEFNQCASFNFIQTLVNVEKNETYIKLFIILIQNFENILKVSKFIENLCI